MAYLMGIDLGTSSVKTIIIDIDSNVKAMAQEEYSIEIPYEGYAEQRPEIWWKATVNTIKEALAKSGIKSSEIKGIGLSGQMHGMVLIDKNLKVIRPAIIWCDQRSKSEVDAIYKKIGRDKLGRLTLNPVATGFQISSLLWVKYNEYQNYNNTYKVLLPKDYIRLRLTNEIGTDITDASSTLAFDTSNRKWSEYIIKALELDIDKYPGCYNPFDLAGVVTREASQETGLACGTPVVFGGGDQPMQAVGNGVIYPGIVSSTIGTGGQVFTVIDKPLYDDELRTHTFCNAIPGTWNIMGASLCSGLSLRWLRDNILNGLDYHIIDEMASNILPGSEGLIFLPYLTGERTPHMDPYAKGIFFGLSLKHTNAHMIRAVLEGVTFSLRDSLEIFKQMGIKMDRLVASGGGARSSLWLQIQADVFGVEVYRSKATEHACMGAAIMAGVGTGVYASVQEACEHIVKYHQEPVLPNSKNMEIYNYYYGIYKEIYPRNKDLFKRIGEYCC